MQKQTIFDNYHFDEDSSEFSFITFTNSDFSKSNLRAYEFTDCIFSSCDFSMACFENILLTRVKFINCKLLGIDFGKCSKFGFSASFENCILNYCFFLRNNLKRTLFKNCILKEASFAEADLSSASFIECDLEGTVFEKCNLEGCDFRTAFNYSIIPSENRMKKAMFSYSGIPGLLKHYNIIIE